MASGVLELSKSGLLPDIYAHWGKNEPHRVFTRILYDEEDGAVEEITWGRLYLDARRAASHLLAYSPLGARSTGSAPSVPTAFLANSGYMFYVYEVAAFLLGWAVSSCRW